jgi:hypothetical protein
VEEPVDEPKANVDDEERGASKKPPIELPPHERERK